MTCAPTGRGMYVWSQYDFAARASFYAGFSFVAIEFTHARSREKAAELKEAGLAVYGFSGPDSWEPSRWRRAFDQAERWCDDVGAPGYFPDGEDVWPSASDAQAFDFGRTLASSSRYVCFTSYPLLPRLEALAAGAEGKIDGSPQIYPQMGNPAQWRAWFAKWKRLFQRCIPSLSLHRATAGPHAERPQYASYLRAVPAARAVVGWSSGVPEAWRVQSFLSDTRIDPLQRIIAPFTCYWVPIVLVALALVVGALLVRSA